MMSVMRVLQAVLVMAAVLLLHQAAGMSVEAKGLNTTQSVDQPNSPTRNPDLSEPPTDLLLKHGIGEEPKVQPLLRPCNLELESYCLNGACYYAPDLDMLSCRCKPTFSGSRCEHEQLPAQRPSSPEEVIGITCGIFLLLTCIAVLLYCVWKKRVFKSPLSYKNTGQNNPV